MKISTTLVAALVILTTLEGLALGDQSSDPLAGFRRLFREGNELMGKGKHAEALEKYERALKLQPEAKGPLYNGGLAAFLLKRYDAAVLYWLRLKTLDTSDAQVRAKLVQAYAALGRTKDRDAEIAALYKLRKESEDPELKKLRFFCREQLEIGKRRVVVFEHFEWVGERAVKWVFRVLDEKGKEVFRYSLGSYATTHGFAREAGFVKEGQRYCHLDGYPPDGSHHSLGFFAGLPAYDDIKARVVKLLSKKGD